MKNRSRITLLIIAWLFCLVVAVSGTAKLSMERSVETSRNTIRASIEKMSDDFATLILDEAAIKQDYETENQALGGIVSFLQAHDMEEKVPDKAHLEKYAEILDASYIAVIDPKDKIISSVGEPVCEEQSPRSTDISSIVYSLITAESIQDIDTAVYEAEMKDGYRLRYEVSAEKLNELIKGICSWQTAIKRMKLPDNASFVIISRRDGSILLHQDEELIGKDLTALGYASEDEMLEAYQSEDESGISWSVTDAKLSGMHETNNMYLICEVPRSTMGFFFWQSILSQTLLYFIISTIVLLYIIFHLTERKSAKIPSEAEDIRPAVIRWIEDWTWARRLMVCSLTALVVFGIVSLDLQFLSSESQINSGEVRQASMIEEAEADNLEIQTELDTWYKERGIRIAKAADYVLQQDEALLTRTNLKDLANTLKIAGIYRFGQDGQVQVTSTRFDRLNIYKEPDRVISKAFLPLLDGWPDSAWTSLTNEEDNRANMYAGVSIRNKRDLCDGCLGIVKTLPGEVSGNGVYTIYSDILNTVSDTEADSQKLISSTQGKTTRLLITDLAVCLLLLFIFTTARGRKESEPEPVTEETEPLPMPEEAPHDAEAEHQKLQASFTGIARATKDDYFFTRWHWNSTPIRYRSAEQKLAFMLKTLFFIFAVFIIVGYVTVRNRSEINSSIMNNLFSGQWERSFNLYSITAAVLIVVVSAVLVELLHKLMFLIAFFSSPRGETVCHLLNSIISYLAVFVVAFYSLMLLGIDAKTILASAGVITVVIGFGAQSLIADILAGIFLIFDDTIHVGDYIYIGDITMKEPKGLVMEIGIRITKLKYYGNIISVNNSRIKSLHNKSGGDAFVSCMLPVSITEDLEHVEAIIKRELPAINRRLQATGGCTSDLIYTGVKSFDTSGYVLRFKVFSVSYYHGRIERLLNAEIIRMCQKNNISTL